MVQLGLKAVHIQNQSTFRTNQENLYIYIHEYLQAQPKRGIPFLKIWFDPIPFRYDLSFAWQEISYYIVGVPVHVRPIRKEIEDLALHKPHPSQLPQHEDLKEMVCHYLDGQGRARIKGGKDLKGSQAHPRWLLVLFGGPLHCLVDGGYSVTTEQSLGPWFQRSMSSTHTHTHTHARTHIHTHIYPRKIHVHLQAHIYNIYIYV